MLMREFAQDPKLESTRVSPGNVLEFIEPISGLDGADTVATGHTISPTRVSG